MKLKNLALLSVLLGVCLPDVLGTPIIQRVLNMFHRSKGSDENEEASKTNVASNRDLGSIQVMDTNEFKHHDYEELTWFLKYYAKKYPDITNLYSIGYSVQDRNLWAMEISKKPGKHEIGRPELKYIGNIHGNEATGRELLLLFIKYLCENYKRDQEVKDIVDNTAIHILPSMNPDGYEKAAVRGRSNPIIGRSNSKRVDLNKNFPDQFFPSTTGPPQPETTAVMEWIKSRPFVLSASLHSGALVALYPYDDSPSGQSLYSATPDDDVFRKLAKSYSQSHPTMHLANPKWNCTGEKEEHFIDGITNGANWYSLSGGMQDYNYVHSNCFEVTLELGCQRFPKANELKTYWDDNKEALMNLAKQVHYGIHGYVRNLRGEPLSGAVIQVADRRHDITSAENGDYWRLLVPGSYEITASAKDYEPQTRLVELGNKEGKELNFILKPIEHDQPQFNGRDRDEESFRKFMAGDFISDALDPREKIPAVHHADQDDEEINKPHHVILLDRSTLTPVEDALAKDTSRESTNENSTGDKDEILIGGKSTNQEEPEADETSGELTSGGSGVLDNEFGPIEGDKRTEIPKDQAGKTGKTGKDAPKVTEEKHNKHETGSGKAKAERKTKTADKIATTQSTTASKVVQKKPQHLVKKALHVDAEKTAKVERKFKHILGTKVACRLTGKKGIKMGVLKWIGNLPSLPKDMAHLIAGVELSNDDKMGTDGTYRGVRYFASKAKRGYFFRLADCKAVKH